MKFSIGIDLVDINNLEKRLKRTSSLKNRLFTHNEIKSASKKLASHFALIVAIKEAFKKASGIKKLSWLDIETRNAYSSKPLIVLNKNLKEKFVGKKIEVSASETNQYATAIVILYG